MRFLYTIASIILALLAVAFAVENREVVSVGFWPLPWQVVMPLFLVVLGAASIGFLCGGLVAWWSGRRARAAARRRAREITQLEAKIAVLQAERRAEAVRADQAHLHPPVPALPPAR